MKPNDPTFTVQDVVETAVEVGDDGCCCYLCSRCRGSGGGSGCGGDEEGEGGEEGDGERHMGKMLLAKHTNNEPGDDDEVDDNDNNNNGQHDTRRQR